MNSEKESYFKVFVSFTDELHLSGLELLVYSLLYGFCTQGKGRFNGSLGYIARRTGSSKNGVRKALNGLVGKGLIKKELPLRKGKDLPVYTITGVGGSTHTADGGDVLSGQEGEPSGSNIKVKEKQKNKNDYPDHLDMTRGELSVITDPEERRSCVKEFAYLFSSEDCDRYDAQYVSIVGLISEMVTQVSAKYLGESVSSDSVWQKFVLNLREDYLGLSIRDFITIVVEYVDDLSVKEVRSLNNYLKAVIWRLLNVGSSIGF